MDSPTLAAGVTEMCGTLGQTKMWNIQKVLFPAYPEMWAKKREAKRRFFSQVFKPWFEQGVESPTLQIPRQTQKPTTRVALKHLHCEGCSFDLEKIAKTRLGTKLSFGVPLPQSAEPTHVPGFWSNLWQTGVYGCFL